MNRFTLHSNKARQRGVTIPMLAVFILALFMIASLAVDLGILYTSKTSAQHAADSAALAGAYTFLNAAGATNAEKITNATNAAKAAAGKNKILMKAVTLADADVSVDVANQRVSVTIPTTNAASDITLYFARAMGWTSSTIAAKATAEAGPQTGTSNCLKPIFLPNTILSSLSPASAACSAGQVIFDPNNTNQYSTWFTTYQQTLYNGYQPLTAAPMSIRPTAPSGALTPSQFYSIDFGSLLGSNSGANTYRCALGQCLTDCTNLNLTPEVICGQAFPLETGNMNGPTNQGVTTLIGNSPDVFGGIDSTNQFFYKLGGVNGTPAYSSRSVALVPVWNDCPDTVSSGYHGQNVTIVGFVTVFFKGMNSGDVQAYFLSATKCSGTTPGGAVGATFHPIRLIQNP